jgi:hypothetical protein
MSYRSGMAWSQLATSLDNIGKIARQREEDRREQEQREFERKRQLASDERAAQALGIERAKLLTEEGLVYQPEGVPIQSLSQPAPSSGKSLAGTLALPEDTTAPAPVVSPSGPLTAVGTIHAGGRWVQVQPTAEQRRVNEGLKQHASEAEMMAARDPEGFGQRPWREQISVAADPTIYNAMEAADARDATARSLARTEADAERSLAGFLRDYPDLAHLGRTDVLRIGNARKTAALRLNQGLTPLQARQVAQQDLAAAERERDTARTAAQGMRHPLRPQLSVAENDSLTAATDTTRRRQILQGLRAQKQGTFSADSTLAEQALVAAQSGVNDQRVAMGQRVPSVAQPDTVHTLENARAIRRALQAQGKTPNEIAAELTRRGFVFQRKR